MGEVRSKTCEQGRDRRDQLGLTAAAKERHRLTSSSRSSPKGLKPSAADVLPAVGISAATCASFSDRRCVLQSEAQISRQEKDRKKRRKLRT